MFCIVYVTKKGKVKISSANEIRIMGRNAKGMIGISLDEEDEVVASFLIDKEPEAPKDELPEPMEDSGPMPAEETPPTPLEENPPSSDLPTPPANPVSSPEPPNQHGAQHMPGNNPFE